MIVRLWANHLAPLGGSASQEDLEIDLSTQMPGRKNEEFLSNNCKAAIMQDEYKFLRSAALHCAYSKPYADVHWEIC